VNNPPKGVLTPEASFTADLEKLAEVGIELKNPPIIEEDPKEIISCVASTFCPDPNAFEMATFCRMEIKAMTKGPVDIRDQLSKKFSCSVPSNVELLSPVFKNASYSLVGSSKGGKEIEGKPP
jgi:hypothetical protein